MKTSASVRFFRILRAGVLLATVAAGCELLAQAAKPAAPAAKTAPAAATKPVPAAAPAAEPLAPPLAVSNLKAERTTVTKLLREGVVPDAERRRFEAFYNTFFLAQWTSPERAGELPELRRQLRNDLQLAKQGKAHNDLAMLVLNFMKTAAETNYPAVVRVNAMLAIGELNQVEAGVGGPAVLAVPMPEATRALLAAVQNVRLPDGVKVAALSGLVRHAQLGIREEGIRREVVTAMLALARAPRADGRSAGGHAWMRAQAIDVLAGFRQAGENNAIADALLQIAAAPESPALVAKAAARGLARIDYAAARTLPPARVAVAMAKLAGVATQQAKAEVEAGKDAAAAGRRLQGTLDAARDAVDAACGKSPPAALKPLVDPLVKLADLVVKAEPIDAALVDQAANLGAALAAAADKVK